MDQIISNMPQYMKSITVLPPVGQSDRCTVAASLFFRVQKVNCFDRHIWDYSRADFDIFRQKLNEADWDACFDTDCIDTACNMWTQSFLSVAQSCIPNRNVTIRANDAPWYTSKLRTQKRKVEGIHRKAKASNENPHIWRYFRDLRNAYSVHK